MRHACCWPGVSPTGEDKWIIGKRLLLSAATGQAFEQLRC